MLIKFSVFVALPFYLSFVCGVLTNRTDDFVNFMLTQPHSSGEYFHNFNKCTIRLHNSLEKLRRRQAHLKSAAFIDLSGYALHQSLRHLPLDMYVTDIRVKTPGVGDWVRIQKCHFSNRDNRMTAQILFNDLTISGTVRLLDDNEILKNSFHPTPREFCKMSLRLQRAGLGINAFPTRSRSRGIDVKTEARFMDPQFLSVHAYGCKLNDIIKRSENPNEDTSEGFSDEHAKDKYVESHIQGRLPFSPNQTEEYSTSGRRRYFQTSARSVDQETTEKTFPQEEPEVRIITLNPGLRTSEDSTKWFNLHKEQETNLNDFHRHRILSTRLHELTERDKLNAVLYIRNLIAQQANHVFQTQGPFSQMPKPMFKPFKQTLPHSEPHAVISTITELDEKLSPIRPVPQRPFEALFSQSEQILNQPNQSGMHNYFEEVSKEMEDIFLRGIKTLLTRYVEKQLEIPLKEALMVNFGYTVSYG